MFFAEVTQPHVSHRGDIIVVFLLFTLSLFVFGLIYYVLYRRKADRFLFNTDLLPAQEASFKVKMARQIETLTKEMSALDVQLTVILGFNAAIERNPSLRTFHEPISDVRLTFHTTWATTMFVPWPMGYLAFWKGEHGIAILELSFVETMLYQFDKVRSVITRLVHRVALERVEFQRRIDAASRNPFTSFLTWTFCTSRQYRRQRSGTATYYRTALRSVCWSSSKF